MAVSTARPWPQQRPDRGSPCSPVCAKAPCRFASDFVIGSRLHGLVPGRQADLSGWGHLLSSIFLMPSALTTSPLWQTPRTRIQRGLGSQATRKQTYQTTSSCALHGPRCAIRRPTCGHFNLSDHRLRGGARRTRRRADHRRCTRVTVLLS